MPEQMKFTIRESDSPAFPVSVWNEETNAAVALFASDSEARSYRLHLAMDDSERLEDALRVVRADYYSDVRDTADNIKAELHSRLADQECGETLREWLLEHIHETIDGSSRVIYTQSAMLGVFASSNDGAYFDDFGSEGAVEDGAINWSRLCFSAFERDVIEQLESIGVDVNNPVPACARCSEDDQEERYADPLQPVDGEFICESCKDEITGTDEDEDEDEEKETETNG